jgi:Sulfotransferase family
MGGPQGDLIVVLGRGNSGTRVLSQALYASRVFMGELLNASGDLVPAQPLYDACRIIGRHVRCTDGLQWDFEPLHEMAIDTEFSNLVQTYLQDVLASEAPRRGWKLPETLLVYPWIVRMFPDAKYVHMVRDPRDCLLRTHITDDLRGLGVSYPETDDKLEQRVASWAYQQAIFRETPHPEKLVSIKYEDLVLRHDATMRQLEGFLEIPLARVVVDESRVGRWRSDGRLLPYVAPLRDEMRELGYE